MTSSVHTDSDLTISEHDYPGHTWRDDRGTVWSTVQLGTAVHIAFDSAADARAAAERCLKAAAAIDAMNAGQDAP